MQFDPSCPDRVAHRDPTFAGPFECFESLRGFAGLCLDATQQTARFECLESHVALSEHGYEFLCQRFGFIKEIQFQVYPHLFKLSQGGIVLSPKPVKVEAGPAQQLERSVQVPLATKQQGEIERGAGNRLFHVELFEHLEGLLQVIVRLPEAIQLLTDVAEVDMRLRLADRIVGQVELLEGHTKGPLRLVEVALSGVDSSGVVERQARFPLETGSEECVARPRDQDQRGLVVAGHS